MNEQNLCSQQISLSVSLIWILQFKNEFNEEINVH